MFGYRRYIDGDVFKDHDYQVYFDQQSDDDKKSLLRQAVSLGHPQGAGVDEEPPEDHARTDNVYLITV